MRRGFKAQAERSAASARQALGVATNAPINPWAYASHLGIRVLDFYQLGLRDTDVAQLTVIDGDSWSAMTLQFASQHSVIVNPAHALTRQRNDLMHELAHIELEHNPVRVEVSETGLLLLSDYSDEQEQEADWLAAALLLPREGLVRFRAARLSAVDIANHYGVSSALCEWRLRTTGVDVQMRRASY
jgi:Zn-dependent peptidase ImmA (M78 family)